MPKQITKTVYTFAELLELEKKKEASATAVQRARQWLSDGATDGDWHEYTYELWQKALAEVGFTDADISYSGFWSQGDGASFTASIDLEKMVDFLATEINPSECIDCDTSGVEKFRPWIAHKIKKATNPKFRHLLAVANYIELGVSRTSSHYVHERTCQVDADLRDRGELITSNPWKWESRTPKLRKLFDDFAEAVEELRLDLSKAIYSDLEEEYEYQTSDESLIDMSDANDYTFTIDGRSDG